MTSLKERQAWNFKGSKICSLDEQTKKYTLHTQKCARQSWIVNRKVQCYGSKMAEMYNVSRCGLKRRLDGNCIYIQGEKKCIKSFTANLGLYFIKQ
jgi:hypothetical protein